MSSGVVANDFTTEIKILCCHVNLVYANSQICLILKFDTIMCPLLGAFARSAFSAKLLKSGTEKRD